MRRIAGTHLIIDAYCAEASALMPEHVISVFDDIVAAVAMERLGEPLVRSLPVDPDKLGTDDDEGGHSIVMPITTSHLAAHTWPLRCAVMIDIFSCRDYDVDRAFAIAASGFHFTDAHRHVVQRMDPRDPPSDID